MTGEGKVTVWRDCRNDDVVVEQVPAEGLRGRLEMLSRQRSEAVAVDSDGRVVGAVSQTDDHRWVWWSIWFSPQAARQT